MTQASNVLDYLWSVGPDGVTNSQIAQHVGISSHQTVYMLTQSLARRGLIRAEQTGRTWRFYAIEPWSISTPLDKKRNSLAMETGEVATLNPWQFEALARRVMSEHYGVDLGPGTVQGVHKKFDLVSADHTIVGDGKYYTLVQGVSLPPAKFSAIAEHVWLLEKTQAPVQFLVFGNDRAVPTLWLKRYGQLLRGVSFFFLGNGGTLERLT